MGRGVRATMRVIKCGRKLMRRAMMAVLLKTKSLGSLVHRVTATTRQEKKRNRRRIDG